MNITGQQVKLKDGTITIVKSHDNHLHIMVNGVEKIFNYETAFKSGYITAVDTVMQKDIMNDIANAEEAKLFIPVKKAIIPED